MRALTPGRCHPHLPGLPTSCARPSPRSIATHVMPPGHRFHRHGSVTHVLQTSPLCGRLVETARRIAFVLLRTEASLPVAPHPPLAVTQCPSATEVWHTPTRTCPVLIRRHWRRTTQRATGGLSTSLSSSGASPWRTCGICAPF